MYKEIASSCGRTDGRAGGRASGRTDGRAGGRAGGRVDGAGGINWESLVALIF